MSKPFFYSEGHWGLQASALPKLQLPVSGQGCPKFGFEVRVFYSQPYPSLYRDHSPTHLRLPSREVPPGAAPPPREAGSALLGLTYEKMKIACGVGQGKHILNMIG